MIRTLNQISDGAYFATAVIISVTKEGVKFSTAGDIGTANIVCRQNKTVDKVYLYYFSMHVASLNLFHLIFGM